jgi:PRC-barrel domain
MHSVRRVASVAMIVVAGGLPLTGSLPANAQTPPPAAGKPSAATPNPTTPAAPAAPGKLPKIPSGTSAAVLGKNKAQAILGQPVVSAKGESMGRIVDVIVDREGMPRAAIIDFGGFLGVGSRKIAVDWSALHFSPTGKSERITLDLTRDQLKSAPAYEKGKPVVVLGPKGGTQPMPSGEYPLDQ